MIWKRKIEPEILELKAKITVLEGTVKQKDELIAFWKGRIDSALSIQNTAEQRQLDAFEKFTKCMDMLAQLKGYKEAVQDVVKATTRD